MTIIPHSRLDLERLASRFAVGTDREQGSRHFLRVKIPNGILNSQQFKGISILAEKFGRGYAEVTDRQDIQLHWIETEDAVSAFNSLDSLGFTTDKCGQSYPAARYGDVRNIVGCPVAGVEKDEVIDASPIVRRLTNYFSGNQNYLDLPRKFKTSISGCRIRCTDPEVNDLSFVGVRMAGGIGYAVLVGGGVGAPPMLAKPLGVIVWPEEVFDFDVAVVEIFRDHGERRSKARARFKWLVAAWGVEKLRSVIEGKLGRRLENYLNNEPILGGEEHIGVRPQKQDGRFYVNVPILGGVLSTREMQGIVKLSERYGTGELRLTPFQNIVIINVPRENLSDLQGALEGIGLSVKTPSVRWTTVACAGNFCGKASENPKQRAAEVLSQLERELGTAVNDLNLRLAISGCPNACGRHVVADIGLQAVKIRVNGRMETGYNLYLKQGTDHGVSVAEIVRRGVPANEVGDVLTGVAAAYLRQRRDSENFAEFCGRCEKEWLQDLVKGSGKYSAEEVPN